jgi:hypothetical protein
MLLKVLGNLRECTQYRRVALVNVATLDWNPSEDIRAGRVSLVKAATLGGNSNKNGLQE